MSELGNVFDAIEAEAEAAKRDPGRERGRDLFADVELDARHLGARDGQRVHVARELPPFDDRAGAPLPRVQHPNDLGEQVHLHVAQGFPEGGALKLRAQGQAGSGGGPAGDLILRIRFVRGAGSLALGPSGALDAQRGEGTPMIWGLAAVAALALVTWLVLSI